MIENKERILNFADAHNLTLVTADYRLFTDPFGPFYPGAVGTLTEFNKTSLGWFRGRQIYLSTISPKLPDGGHFPVDLIIQDNETIIVRINYEYSKYLDLDKVDGREITLTTYQRGESDGTRL